VRGCDRGVRLGVERPADEVEHTRGRHVEFNVAVGVVGCAVDGMEAQTKEHDTRVRESGGVVVEPVDVEGAVGGRRPLELGSVDRGIDDEAQADIRRCSAIGGDQDLNGGVHEDAVAHIDVLFSDTPALASLSLDLKKCGLSRSEKLQLGRIVHPGYGGDEVEGSRDAMKESCLIDVGVAQQDTTSRIALSEEVQSCKDKKHYSERPPQGH